MQYMCAGLVYIYIHKTAAERERVEIESFSHLFSHAAAAL
jgi:hypothetical protein